MNFLSLLILLGLSAVLATAEPVNFKGFKRMVRTIGSVGRTWKVVCEDEKENENRVRMLSSGPIETVSLQIE